MNTGWMESDEQIEARKKLILAGVDFARRQTKALQIARVANKADRAKSDEKTLAYQTGLRTQVLQ